MEIRIYKPGDRQSVIRCEAELQDHIQKLDSLGRERPKADFDSERYMETIFRQVEEGGGQIFVAEEAGQIIGFIAGTINQDSEAEQIESYPTKDGKILELIVLSDHRGKRIGVQLMEIMEVYFKEKGCNGVLVDCFGPNKGTYEFYKKCGYDDRLISMLKIL